MPVFIHPTEADYHLKSYHYDLPESCIASEPVEPRDAARMMVIPLDTPDAPPMHEQVSTLPIWLREGDLLVMNNTRVLQSRFFGHKQSVQDSNSASRRSRQNAVATLGATIEWLFLHPVSLVPVAEGAETSLNTVYWLALAKPAKRLRAGDCVTFPGLKSYVEVLEAPPVLYALTGMTCEIPEGAKLLQVHLNATDFAAMQLTAPPTVYDLMALYGTIPIPPYFKREATEADKTRYQTVYAETPGSQAAPTAGLHFTPTLLEALKAKGIDHTFITLDVGIGTFRPVSVADIRHHQLHAERYTVTEATAEKIRAVKQAGGRIIAVGTTSVRTLETVARLADDTHPYLKASSGESALYIYPGFEFKLVEGLMTNFHLPESSLLMLVSALIGRERLLSLYKTAVTMNYRFFSYGDCCLIIPS